MGRVARPALKEALALKIAKGSSTAAAARALDMPERTARSWVGAPAFQSMVTGFRKDISTRAISRFAAGLAKSADTIRKILDDKSLDPETRLKAAVALVDKFVALNAHLIEAGMVDELRGRLNESPDADKNA
jgi:hypothetical protein